MTCGMAMAAKTSIIAATTISPTRENPQVEARQGDNIAWRFFPSKTRPPLGELLFRSTLVRTLTQLRRRFFPRECASASGKQTAFGCVEIAVLTWTLEPPLIACLEVRTSSI